MEVRIHEHLADGLRNSLRRRRIHRERGLPRNLLEAIETGGDDGSTAGKCFRDRNREGFRKGWIQEDIGQRVDGGQVLLIDPSGKVNVPAVSSVRNRVLRPESLAALASYYQLV